MPAAGTGFVGIRVIAVNRVGQALAHHLITESAVAAAALVAVYLSVNGIPARPAHQVSPPGDIDGAAGFESK